MKSVAIVSKPDKPELAKILPFLLEWLEKRDYKVVFDRESSTYFSDGHQLFDREKLVEVHPKFVIVLGGDGTLLSAARALAGSDTPILGVNLGSLGFLTEIPIGDLYATLDAMELSVCQIEPRSMLECQLLRQEKCASEYVALNDAVITKSALARLGSYELYIDGSFVSTYRGDGLIVATPTGSTAYSLAAGGPILTPDVAGLVITPICPHALTHRPLVVPDSVEMEIVVQSTGEQAFLSIDGQEGMPVIDGDRLKVRKSKHGARLVRLQKGFFDVLRNKLKWGQR